MLPSWAEHSRILLSYLSSMRRFAISSLRMSDLGNGHFECPSINDVPAGGFVCVPVGVAFTAISEPYDDVRTPMKYTPGLVRVHYHTEWWRAETTIIIEGVRF